MTIEFTITHDPESGSISINGPLDQELYCYGLLEKARQTVMNHNVKRRADGLIVPARMSVDPR